jgi:hypothetical protein
LYGVSSYIYKALSVLSYVLHQLTWQSAGLVLIHFSGTDQC